MREVRVHDLNLGWSIPAGYKRREIFVGKRGRTEIEVVDGAGLRLREYGVLSRKEGSQYMDWSAVVIAQIRKELGV